MVQVGQLLTEMDGAFDLIGSDGMPSLTVEQALNNNGIGCNPQLDCSDLIKGFRMAAVGRTPDEMQPDLPIPQPDLNQTMKLA